MKIRVGFKKINTLDKLKKKKKEKKTQLLKSEVMSISGGTSNKFIEIKSYKRVV